MSAASCTVSKGTGSVSSPHNTPHNSHQASLLLVEVRAKQHIGHARAEDPQLAEFMRVMQPRRQAAIWANDDAPQPARPSQAPPAAPAAARAPAGGAAAPAGPALGPDETPGNTLPLPPRRGRRAAQWAAVTATVSGGSDGEEEREASGSEASDSSKAGEGVGGGAGGTGAAAANDAVSDMDYLRSRMTAALGDDAGEEPPESTAANAEASVGDSGEGSDPEGSGLGSGSEDDDVAGAERRASHAQAGPRGGGVRLGKRVGGAAGSGAEVVVAGAAGEAEPPIEDTGRLFVRNLPYAATEADLAEAFGEHGELEEVHLVLDKCGALCNVLLKTRGRPRNAMADDASPGFELRSTYMWTHLYTFKCGCRATRKSRGIALVQFAEPAGAAAAAAALDGAIFQGRLLHVLPARAPPARAAAQACLRGPASALDVKGAHLHKAAA